MFQLADNFVFIQAQHACVLPHKTFGEDATRQFVKTLRFDGVQKLGGDLGFARNLIEVEMPA